MLSHHIENGRIHSSRIWSIHLSLWDLNIASTLTLGIPDHFRYCKSSFRWLKIRGNMVQNISSILTCKDRSLAQKQHFVPSFSLSSKCLRSEGRCNGIKSLQTNSSIRARNHGWNVGPMTGVLFCLCVGPDWNGQGKFQSFC